MTRPYLRRTAGHYFARSEFVTTDRKQELMTWAIYEGEDHQNYVNQTPVAFISDLGLALQLFPIKGQVKRTEPSALAQLAAFQEQSTLDPADSSDSHETRRHRLLVTNIAEHGPTRVVINIEGETKGPDRAKREHDIEPDIIYVRDDGWSLGATFGCESVAHRTWHDRWMLIMHKNDGQWSWRPYIKELDQTDPNSSERIAMVLELQPTAEPIPRPPEPELTISIYPVDQQVNPEKSLPAITLINTPPLSMEIIPDECAPTTRDCGEPIRNVITWEGLPGSGFNPEFTGYTAGHYMTGLPQHGWCLYSRGPGGCWNQRTKEILPPRPDARPMQVKDQWLWIVPAHPLPVIAQAGGKADGV